MSSYEEQLVESLDEFLELLLRIIAGKNAVEMPR